MALNFRGSPIVIQFVRYLLYARVHGCIVLITKGVERACNSHMPCQTARCWWLLKIACTLKAKSVWHCYACAIIFSNHLHLNVCAGHMGVACPLDTPLVLRI